MSGLDGFDLAAGNPAFAKEQEPLLRRNIARLVKNEVIDMPERLKQASNIPLSQPVPFWQITYHTLDAQREDGTPLEITFGTRLFNDKGQPLSQGQRPWVATMAFKGLGIVAYPFDPNYDQDKVVGHVFEIEEQKFATGKPAYVPVAYVGGPDYQYTGEVRIVRARNQQNDAVGFAPGQSATREVTEDASLAQRIVNALAGLPASDTNGHLNVLRQQGLTEAVHVGGLGIVSLTATGKLVPKLAELGLVEVKEDGTIAALVAA